MSPKISAGNNTVLKYTYTRNKIPNTEDSSYVEEIYIELDSKNIETNLKDAQLANVKVVFARLCFCKGQTGYYKVTNGELSIKKNIY